MTDQELVKKIKGLKKIQPSKEWLSSVRHGLVNRIDLSESDSNQKTEFSSLWFSKFSTMALVFGLLIVNVIAGPWLLARASRSSLPGEMLYAVKKATEGVRVKVTSEENKSQLQVELANRRLEELNKIAARFISDDNTKQAKKVIGEFNENLNEMKNSISKENAVAVAKQTRRIEQDFIKAKEDISGDAQVDIEEAERTIDDIKNQILTVLIGDDRNGSVMATSSDEEILIFLQDKKDIDECDLSVEGILESENE
ncbi:MAG: DUF5667 domain-containing protein [bacterium]